MFHSIKTKDKYIKLTLIKLDPCQTGACYWKLRMRHFKSAVAFLKEVWIDYDLQVQTGEFGTGVVSLKKKKELYLPK